MILNPLCTVKRTGNSAKVLAAVEKIRHKQVYVGIPAADLNTRSATLLKMAATTPGISKKADLMRAAKEDFTNAELLFIHSKDLRSRASQHVL
jgi:hypothetical protein